MAKHFVVFCYNVLGQRCGWMSLTFSSPILPFLERKSRSVYPKNDGPASFVQSRIAPSYGEMNQGWSDVWRSGGR